MQKYFFIISLTLAAQTGSALPSYLLGDANDKRFGEMQDVVRAVALIKVGDQFATGFFIAPNVVLASANATDSMDCPSMKIHTQLKHSAIRNREPKPRGLDTFCSKIIFESKENDVRLIRTQKPSRYFAPISNDMHLEGGSQFSVASYVTGNFVAIAKDCMVVAIRGPNAKLKLGRGTATNLRNGFLANCISDDDAPGGAALVKHSGKWHVVGIYTKRVHLTKVSRSEYEVIDAAQKEISFRNKFLTNAVLDGYTAAINPLSFFLPLRPDVQDEVTNAN